MDEDVIVNLDIEIHWQIEVVGKGADNAVHEAVDGADGKVGVVVEDRLSDDGGIALEGCAIEARAVGNVGAHGGASAEEGDIVQFAQYAFLHFVGGFVGEGDGKNSLETGWEFLLLGGEGQEEVLADEGVGLAGARRGTADDEATVIHNKMQKYDFFLNLRKCGLRMERLNVKNAFFSFFFTSDC